MSRARSGSLCAILTLCFLAGCGGGSSAPKTQAEYVAKANKICHRLSNEIHAVAQKGGLQQKLNSLITIRERADKELEAIKKFPGDKWTPAWLSFRRKALAALRELSKKGLFAKASRPVANEYTTQIVRSAAIAQAYGLNDCRLLASS
jgi:hypothetical protein